MHADETQRQVHELSRAAGLWVLVGFLGFGSVLGFVTGASKTDGIGQSLLTGLLAFVGGGLLSVIAFVFKQDESPHLRAKAIGQALLGLAIGTWFGLGSGIGARIAFERAEDERIARIIDQQERRTAERARRAPAAPQSNAASAAQANPGKRPTVPARTDAPEAPAGVLPRVLVHGDRPSCAKAREDRAARQRTGYYERHPQAWAVDLATEEDVCPE